jgi:hypothetical protein
MAARDLTSAQGHASPHECSVGGTDHRERASWSRHSNEVDEPVQLAFEDALLSLCAP